MKRKSEMKNKMFIPKYIVFRVLPLLYCVYALAVSIYAQALIIQKFGLTEGVLTGLISTILVSLLFIFFGADNLLSPFETIKKAGKIFKISALVILILSAVGIINNFLLVFWGSLAYAGSPLRLFSVSDFSRLFQLISYVCLSINGIRILKSKRANIVLTLISILSLLLYHVWVMVAHPETYFQAGGGRFWVPIIAATFAEASIVWCAQMPLCKAEETQ